MQGKHSYLNTGLVQKLQSQLSDKIPTLSLGWEFIYIALLSIRTNRS